MRRDERTQLHSQASTQKYFARLLECVPQHAIADLLNPSTLCSKVYIIRDLHSPAAHPAIGELPWPLLCLASSLNRKHILPSKNINEKLLTDSLSNFENKMRWRYVFRNNTEEQHPLLRLLRRQIAGPTAPCSKIIPVELTIFLAELRKVVARTTARAKYCMPTDSSFILKTCRWLLRRLKLKALETDKDGGYAFCPSHLYYQARLDIFRNGDYVYDAPRIESVVRDYVHLAHRLGRFLCVPGLARAACRSIGAPGAKIASQLVISAKTHKDTIKFRNIHASSMWQLAGLSLCLSSLVQEQLSKHSHILVNSKHFVSKLMQVKAKPSHRFCKMDVEHFFMSGELCASLFQFDPVLQALIYDIAFLLLSNQFVEDKTHHNMYKVHKGSGMGLPHSGAVAESALLAGAELALIRDLAAYHVDLYLRFKDDIFILFDDMPHLRRFVTKLRANHPFEIRCDEISSSKVAFLEVEVSIDKANCQFRIQPVDKTSKLNVPMLSCRSAHPPPVHNSWPVCLLKNKLALSSHRDLKHKVFQDFVQRALASHLSPVAHQAFSVHDPSDSPKRKRGTAQVAVRQIISKHRGFATWCILPFYPALHKSGLSKSVHNLINSHVAKELLAITFSNCAPSVAIGWRNAVPNICRCLLGS